MPVLGRNPRAALITELFVGALDGTSAVSRNDRQDDLALGGDATKARVLDARVPASVSRNDVPMPDPRNCLGTFQEVW